MFGRFITSLVIIVSCAGLWETSRKNWSYDRENYDRLQPPPLSLLSPKALNFAVLGHRNLYHDFTTIWMIQVLADRNFKTFAPPEKIIAFVLKSLRHRPNIEGIYLLSCLALTLQLAQSEACEEISKRGLAALPNSWRIPMMQGFVSSFKLGDHTKAAVYYTIAASRESSPQWVKSLAQKLSVKESDGNSDLNEVIGELREIDGGTKLLNILRPMFKDQVPAPVQSQNEQSTQTPNPTSDPSPTENLNQERPHE
jgi:hypothetical protein